MSYLSTHISSPISSSQGFTLLEILIVVTILTTLGVAGLYSSLAGIEKQRLQSAADTAVTYLETARTYSISTTQSQSWAVEFEVANPHALTQYCFSCPSGQEQAKTYRLPKQVTFKQPLLPGNLIIFQNYTGRSAGPTLEQLKTSPETVTLQSPSWEITITIPPHGLVYADPISKR